MKIECTIKRELEAKDGDRVVKVGPGTKIPMGDQVYVFKPESPDGPHVCEVTDQDHIARFKEIPESFKPGAGVKWPKALPPTSIGKTDDKADDEKDDGEFGAHVPDAEGEAK